MSQIWKQWEGEPVAAYNAFRYYLELRSPRRLNGLSMSLSVNVNTIYDWAKRYSWVTRASAFDCYFKELRDSHLEALLKEQAEEIAKKHVEMLSDLREIVGIELSKHLAQIRSTPRSMMSFSEIVRAGETVIKADRLIRDMSTEAVSVDMTNVSLDVLQSLRDQAKAALKGDEEE